MTPTAALLTGLTSADYDVYRQARNQVVGLGSRAALSLVEQALARLAGRPSLSFHPAFSPPAPSIALATQIKTLVQVKHFRADIRDLDHLLIIDHLPDETVIRPQPQTEVVRMPCQFFAPSWSRVEAQSGDLLLGQGSDMARQIGNLPPDCPRKGDPVGHQRSVTASRKASPVS